MSEPVTVLLCQAPTGLASGERMAWIERMLATPVDTSAKIAVFPELFMSGYGASVADPATAYRHDQDRVAQVQRCCEADQAWAVIGAVTRDEAGYRNSALCLAPDGSLHAQQHKCRLFGDDEAAAFVPAEEPAIFHTPLGRTGMAICFDIEDPALVAQYAQLGAAWVLTPTANMRPYTLVPSVKVRARALDNALGIVYANYTGDDRGLDFPGDSIVVDAQGGVQGQLGCAPGVLQVQVQP